MRYENREMVSIVEAILKRNGFKIVEKRNVFATKGEGKTFSRMVIIPRKGIIIANGVKESLEKYIHTYERL